MWGCSTIRPPSGVQPVQRVLKVTGYCDCRECCAWKRNWLLRPVVASGPSAGKPKAVGQSASGAASRYGTIAADEALFPFGTIMYVQGYGYGRVEDRGRDIKGNHIDLHFGSHRLAMNWGTQEMKVTIWYPPGYVSSPPKKTGRPSTLAR